MRSYQIVEWGKPLEARDRPSPEPAGTEVLLKVSAAGVCHSDIHIWDGYFDMGGGERSTLADRGVKLPHTLGHEIAGEVVAVGAAADGVAVGDKRIAYPWIGCGACAPCARGEEHLCLKPRFLGARVAGGYSDYVLVPHPRYLLDHGAVPAELACTYACAGLTAYSALNKTLPLTDRDHLLVIGAGGVGLSAVHLVRAVVPAKLIVADVDPAKREAARRAGAVETLDNRAPDALRKVTELSGGGVAAAIDFVGRPDTTRFGIDALRKGGVHVIVGLYGDRITLPMPLFPFKAMTVRGSYVGSLAEMNELLALVKAGKVPPIPIETRPLAEAQRALDDLKAGRVLGRVVLKP